MALSFPTPLDRAATDQLRYFKPLRAAISVAVILAAGSALVLWGWFDLRHARAVLEGAILTLVLVFLTVRIFLPRTLVADGASIRWTIQGRGPAREARQAEVRAIRFLTTTGPGRQRYYFVNRDGAALLWVDRFSAQQMHSFANYLGVDVSPVDTPPPVEAETDAVDERWRAVGRKRAQVGAFATVGLLGLAMTIFLAVVAFRSVSEWSAYQRGGVCTQPPSDPLSCRLEATATVTAVQQSRGWTGVHLSFSQDTLAGGDHRSVFEWLLPGTHPQPAPVAGQAATVEVFNGSDVTAVNGAQTRDYQTMKSNATWWYVLVPIIIPIVMGWFAYGSWKSDVTGFERSEGSRRKTRRRQSPVWLRPLARLGGRLWMAWVG